MPNPAASDAEQILQRLTRIRNAAAEHAAVLEQVIDACPALIVEAYRGNSDNIGAARRCGWDLVQSARQALCNLRSVAADIEYGVIPPARRLIDLTADSPHRTRPQRSAAEEETT